MIGNFQNVSFKGTFLVKSPDKFVTKEMPDVVGKRKVIYENINENNDNLYVARDSADKRIQNYLLANNAKFLYYPNLSTANNFYPEKLKEALEKISIAEYLTNDDIRKNISNDNKFVMYKGIIPLKCEYITGFVYKNNIEVKSLRKLPDGTKVVLGGDNKTKAIFSPIGEFGLAFVTVKPENADKHARFYAINKKGEIIYEYKSVDGIKKYYKLFLQAVDYFKNSGKQISEIE